VRVHLASPSMKRCQQTGKGLAIRDQGMVDKEGRERGGRGGGHPGRGGSFIISPSNCENKEWAG